jgi:hypothetical protein
VYTFIIIINLYQARNYLPERLEPRPQLICWAMPWLRWLVTDLSPEWTPGTHWIGGWVGLRAGLGTEAR